MTTTLARREVTLKRKDDSTSAERANFLASRVRLAATLVGIGAFLFFIRGILAHEPRIWLNGVAVAFIAVAGTMARSACSVPRLRVLEVTIFFILTIFIAYRHWSFIGDIAGEVNAMHAMVTIQRLASGIFAITVVYGLVIPNEWRRTCAVTTIMALAGFVLPYLFIAQRLEGSAAAKEMLTFDALSGTGTFVLLGIVASTVGTNAMNRLRSEAMHAVQLGQYKLEKKIGAGGMGEVWAARHAFLARPAAVKLIKPESVDGGSESADTTIMRFEREAQATATLSSPHTVTVYDFGRTCDSCFYYAMEMLDGLDLESIVKRHGPMPGERVAHLLLQVCESLGEAHCRGLVHRDVKPANLFCCRLGGRYDFMKVLDFGLVKRSAALAEAETHLTQASMAVGTPAYISPEAVRGKGELDGRADIYALGCVAYWLLTGQQVFTYTGAMDLAIAHATEAPKPPSKRTHVAIHPELEAIVMHCLEKKPDQRPATTEDLVQRLEAIDFDEKWTQARAREWWETHVDGSLVAT